MHPLQLQLPGLPAVHRQQQIRMRRARALHARTPQPLCCCRLQLHPLTHVCVPALPPPRLRTTNACSYLLSRPDMNEHTCGSLFNAFAMADRLDLALATWEGLAARGTDIGAYGASALVKACARARDVGAALQVRHSCALLQRSLAAAAHSAQARPLRERVA